MTRSEKSFQKRIFTSDTYCHYTYIYIQKEGTEHYVSAPYYVFIKVALAVGILFLIANYLEDDSFIVFAETKDIFISQEAVCNFWVLMTSNFSQLKNRTS
ncbi:hypothetical protein GCM10007183_18720 [Staphylococcus muscae]|uniref:Uncharacterized protein n=1 Tax=Staphylococcus muscae TaxID=1294 RepID=A0ABQ1HXU2_9STAP|nr:hypothetical protein GCM10007183_18720 [Staphylococcus muscae]